jgi:hypothetical protein
VPPGGPASPYELVGRRALDRRRPHERAPGRRPPAESHAGHFDDRAFDWLERSYAQHNLNFRTIKATPLLKNIRGDPRYASLLARIRLPAD